MSIVLQGSTSGSVTLQEPAVAGTTVLTLPAVSGTLITTASSGQSIPKAALPTGSVLQVVNFTSTTYVSISTTTPTATGYSASITPTSSSSKILFTFNCSEFRVPGQVGSKIQLYKNGSALTYIAREFCYCTPIGSGTFGSIISTSYLDSPATTSSVSYQVYASILTGTGTLEFLPNGSSATTDKNLTITLMEIAA